MITNNRIINSPTPQNAPAQTPFEFAKSLYDATDQLNTSLAHLRSRLFGDGEEPTGPDEPKKGDPALLDMISGAHFRLSLAIDQLAAIHNRL